MNACKFARIFASIGIFLFSSISISHAAVSGKINFVGSVVESGCNVEHSQKAIDIECGNNEKNGHITAPTNGTNISFIKGKVTGTQWINAQHSIGMTTITYR